MHGCDKLTTYYLQLQMIVILSTRKRDIYRIETTEILLSNTLTKAPITNYMLK